MTTVEDANAAHFLDTLYKLEQLVRSLSGHRRRGDDRHPPHDGFGPRLATRTTLSQRSFIPMENTT